MEIGLEAQRKLDCIWLRSISTYWLPGRSGLEQDRKTRIRDHKKANVKATSGEVHLLFSSAISAASEEQLFLCIFRVTPLCVSTIFSWLSPPITSGTLFSNYVFCFVIFILTLFTSFLLIMIKSILFMKILF